MHETMDREYTSSTSFTMMISQGQLLCCIPVFIFLLNSQKTELPYEFLIRDYEMEAPARQKLKGTVSRDEFGFC
jgi:hypothetical protein